MSQTVTLIPVPTARSPCGRQGRRGAEWDLAVVDRKRKIVLSGSARMGAREDASTLVRKGQRLASRAAARTGASEAAGPLPVHEAAEGQGRPSTARSSCAWPSPKRSEADASQASGSTSPTTRPRPTGTRSCIRAADGRKLEAAGFSYRVRIADVAAHGPRQPPQGAACGQPAGGARQRAARPPPCPAGGTRTARSRRSRRAASALRAANPGLVRLFTLPERSWVGREIYGIEIARERQRHRRRPAVLRPGRHAPRPRVARQRGHARVGHRAHQRLQGRQPADRRDRQGRPQHHRARSSTSTAST